MSRLTLFVSATVIGLMTFTCSATPADTAENESVPVRIGLGQSLFSDVPAPMIPALLYPFASLMKEATGMDGQISLVDDADDLARRLRQNKMQLGVVEGFDFAWVKQRYPDLKPLCIAINQHRQLQAFLVVSHDCPARDLRELKGQVLAWPLMIGEHCRLFLNRACKTTGTEPAHFFSKIVRPISVEKALDDIVRRKVFAAVVDGAALEGYQRDKPGCFTALKIMQRSEMFPAVVIVYREGSLPEATLARFRDGLTNANKQQRSRELMTLWRLTAFEPIPEDFQKTLTNILKAYPAPASPTTVAGAASAAR